MAERTNKINKRRYFLMSDQMENIVFDYSVKKNTIYCSEKWQELFGYKVELENPQEEMLKYVFEEDKEKFTQSIEELKNGQEKIEENVRILDKDGQAVECHIKLFAIKAKKGKIAKLIGVIDKADN